MVTAGAIDPFSNTDVLAGFELFVRDGGDGAAIPVERTLYRTLYVPHIPVETEQFWTGFTLINPGQETAYLEVHLFTDTGSTAGTYNLVIPAHGKVKGLQDDLFPGSAGLASWGIIHAAKPIGGIEIYGTDSGGICGFALGGTLSTAVTLPLIGTGDDRWTGLALANPGSEAAIVSFTLTAADGSMIAQQTMTLEPGTRIATLLSDLFMGIEVGATDYVRVKASGSIIALEVSGDATNSVLTAVTGLD